MYNLPVPNVSEGARDMVVLESRVVSQIWLYSNSNELSRELSQVSKFGI